MFKCLSASALGLSSDETELIEPALSHGFRAVELDVLDFASRASSFGLDQVRRRLRSAKLQTPQCHLPTDWRGDDETFQQGLADIDRWAELAVAVDCKLALTWIEPVSEERPYHENFEWHRKRFQQLGQALDKHGIRLAVGFAAAADLRSEGNFEFIRDFDALGMLISTVGAKNVGLVVNLWDIWASGGELDKLRKVPPASILAVQVADAAEGADPHEATSAQRMLPGQTGIIDTPAALTMLAELGYRGSVTPVPHPSHFQGQNRNAIVRATSEALDSVWKAAHLTPAGKLAQPQP